MEDSKKKYDASKTSDILKRIACDNIYNMEWENIDWDGWDDDVDFHSIPIDEKIKRCLPVFENNDIKEDELDELFYRESYADAYDFVSNIDYEFMFDADVDDHMSEIRAANKKNPTL